MLDNPTDKPDSQVLLYDDTVGAGEAQQSQDVDDFAPRGMTDNRLGNVNLTTSEISRPGTLRISTNEVQYMSEMSSPSSPNTAANATEDINVKYSKLLLSPGAQNRRSFFDRTFGKLEKGSVRGSIFSLCASAIGGGILSLPYMVVLVGYSIAYLLFIVGTIAGIWSCLMLAHLATTYNLKNYD